jgi:hypothetical protein
MAYISICISILKTLSEVLNLLYPCKKAIAVLIVRAQSAPQIPILESGFFRYGKKSLSTL